MPTPAPQPETPPPHPRRMRFNAVQALGIPLLALLPLLALAGVFGNSAATVAATAGGVRLELDYPTRLRYQADERLAVRLTNTGPAALHGVRVQLTDEYLEHGILTGSHPEVSAIADGWATFELGTLAPGETRQVWADVQADRPGRQAGRARVQAGGAAGEAGTTRAELEFATIFFP